MGQGEQQPGLAGVLGQAGAVAETIENKVRSKILQNHLTDLAYFPKLSAQLRAIIAQRKTEALKHEEHLQHMAALIHQR